MRSFFKVKFNLTFRCSLEKDPKKDTFIFRFPFEFYFKVVDFWEVDTSELKSEVAINVSSQFSQSISLASKNVFSNYNKLQIKESENNQIVCPKIKLLSEKVILKKIFQKVLPHFRTLQLIRLFGKYMFTFYYDKIENTQKIFLQISQYNLEEGSHQLIKGFVITDAELLDIFVSNYEQSNFIIVTQSKDPNSSPKANFAQLRIRSNSTITLESCLPLKKTFSQCSFENVINNNLF